MVVPGKSLQRQSLQAFNFCCYIFSLATLWLLNFVAILIPHASSGHTLVHYSFMQQRTASSWYKLSNPMLSY